MSGQSQDIRREISRLGGSIGGPIAQQRHRDLGVGFFSSENQRNSGRRGAAVNREQGTGGFDPANLQRANDELAKRIEENPELYQKIRNANLEQGRQTQRERGINIGDVYKQRLKSVKYHGVEIEGKRYYSDTEARTYICDTTLEYYIRFAPSRPTRKRRSQATPSNSEESDS